MRASDRLALSFYVRDSTKRSDDRAPDSPTIRFFPEAHSPMKNATLTTYLNDHLALMRGEAELLERVKDENSASPLGESLETFAEAVSRQLDRVRQAIDYAGGSVSSIKQAAAWLGEKLGRLKPNDGIAGYTDLARVVELETLMGLAFSRQTMWAALESIELQCGLNPDERAASEEQTRSQLASLREHHRSAVTRAFDQLPSNL